MAVISGCSKVEHSPLPSACMTTTAAVQIKVSHKRWCIGHPIECMLSQHELKLS